MVIVLPNSYTGLNDLQNDLTTFDLASFNDDMYQRKVFVTMPKFKIETSLNLNGPLKEVSFI